MSELLRDIAFIPDHLNSLQNGAFMAKGTFDPQALQAGLESNPVTTLRELADSIERDELQSFMAHVQGNGMMGSRFGRVVFDVRFSIEVRVHREIGDLAELGGGR